MLNDARSLGSEISEEEFSNALIKGIPYRYNAVALQLGIMISPTLEDIRRVFKLHCERHALPERQHDSNKALNVGMPKYQYDNKNFGGQKYRYENRDYRGQNEWDRTKLICNFCNRRGHTKKFCWFNSGKNNQSTPEGDTKKSFPKSQNIKIAKEGQTQNVQNPIEKTFFVRGIKNTKIIKDDKNQDFKEPRERAFLIKGTKSKKTTNVSNNSVINDKNICSEKIELSNSADERGDIIEQKPELNVPKLTDDLFSVNKLTENGKKIIYDVNGSHAVDKNREICKIESVNTESKIEGILNIGETNWDTWHKRLNHMSAKDMILMKNNNVVHKFDAELPINLNINCDTCVRSKLPKQSFNIVTAPQTEGILDLFHANLEGPLNFKSVGGARYILTLIDDFSQKLFTLFLDTKLEVTDILEDFIEKQTNRRVKTIQTYNGAEIISDKINKLCKKRGIKHLLSATLTPKEIEIANKRSRDLFKGTRDLLVEAQLGPELWGESINTWTYVRNRTPTEFETLKTPEEIFTGIKPSVTHLKVFGCQVCHRYSKRKSSGKLAGMSKLYIFTGYSRCTKKYRILDPDTLETSEIRNLEFKENKKGNILLGTQKYKGDYNLINFEEHQNVSTGHKIKIVEEGNPRSDKYTPYSIMNENNYFNTSHDESDVNIVRKFKICKSAQVENYSQHDFKNYDKKKNVIIQPKATKHMFSESNNVIHQLVQTVSTLILQLRFRWSERS